MRAFLFVAAVSLTASAWAQTPCPSPCQVSLQITGGQLSLVNSSQTSITVASGTEIDWRLVGGSTIFVVFDDNKAFPNKPSAYKGSSSQPAKASPQATTTTEAHYWVFAADSTGKWYGLDPKVVVNPGHPSPVRRRKKI